MHRKRLIDIDIAVGITIILVVYGHLQFTEDMTSMYLVSRDIVYKFHMPLFMFLSGFLMSYTYKPLISSEDYKRFIKKKAIKFLPPYILFSIIFIVLEGVLNRSTREGILQDFIDMLLYPSKSPAGFLWYIYVLFQFYIILPLLMKLANNKIHILLLIAIGLQFFKEVELFNINLFSFYFLFVVLGIIATKYLDQYYKLISRFGILFVVLFVTAIVFSFYYGINKLSLGLLSIPTMGFMSIMIEKTRLKDHLGKIGRHSFYIYLMNTLVMGALYVVFTKYLKFELSPFLLVIFLISGVYLPMIIYNRIIKRNKLLNKIIQ
ncbi:acyltransferase family protein [Winogradskyella sp. 3972H.M.0a.05]|uniref:acyltransferase family protein n=1 Tax=Winogradskyella sp. 3972H.M.0a.05 TaxID=2950277 RepID=UPI003397CDB9